MKKVGFWRSQEEPGLPIASHFIDSSWPESQKLMVINFLDKHKEIYECYMGKSYCRICEITNGAKEYTDGVYVWPEGFYHYIVSHNLKPPQDFIDHVENDWAKWILASGGLWNCGCKI